MYLNADTTLYMFLNALNWRSGSVNEVNEEVSNCLERPIDIHKLTGKELDNTLNELKQCYPMWIAYHKEEEELYG